MADDGYCARRRKPATGHRHAKSLHCLPHSENLRGRGATLTFVCVHHRIEADGALIYEEEQDIVFMTIPETFEPPPPTPAPAPLWRERVAVDPVLLFRFSALTFNGHRIHYDRTYATGVERYPGLMVHGPLQAILMFDAATRRNPGRTPASFAFRGLRPLFDFDEVHVGAAAAADGALNDGALDVFTFNGDGVIGSRATLHFRG